MTPGRAAFEEFNRQYSNAGALPWDRMPPDHQARWQAIAAAVERAILPLAGAPVDVGNGHINPGTGHVSESPA
jgi:hypothetical protein